MENPRWVNEKVVSKMTGLALQTLRNQRCMTIGGIPYSKIRKSVRYRISDVVKFMESKKIIPRDLTK